MLDTTHHRSRVDAELQDPEFRAEYERARAELAQVNELVKTLDRLRVEAGLSKAELARHADRNDAAIRRLFTAESNPELRTIVALATALGAEIRVVPGRRRRSASGRRGAAARSSPTAG